MEEKEMILLVNEEDIEAGYEEKLKVHEKGILHRAYSIFIFNSKKEVLLQKREMSKYHSPGLWTNTCCSHQRMKEKLEEATHRRLQEEMGFDTDLSELFTFIYHIDFPNGLTENELDHVFVGYYEGEINPNPKEVEAYKWVSMEELMEQVRIAPEDYTYWLKECLPRVYNLYKEGRI